MSSGLVYFTLYYPEVAIKLNTKNSETWFENSYARGKAPWTDIRHLYVWRYNTNETITNASSTFLRDNRQGYNPKYVYENNKLKFNCGYEFCFGFFTSVCKEYRSCKKPIGGYGAYILYDIKYEQFNRNILYYTFDKPGTYDNRLIADKYTPKIYKNKWEFHDSNIDCIFCYNEWNLKLKDGSVFHVEAGSTLPVNELPLDIFTVYNFGKNDLNSYYLIKVTGGGGVK